MNKSNKILLGILSFVVVCVVGYALFSETITVTGTATAQGSFDIVGTCQTGVPSEFVAGVYAAYSDPIHEGGYKNDSCSFNGNEATISVELEYPTASRWFTIKLTNNGTIPAILGEIVLKKSDVCTNEGCSSMLDATDTQKEIVSLFKLENNMIIGVQIGDGNPIGLDKVTDEIHAEFLTDNNEQLLKPGNSVYIAVRSVFDSYLGYNKPGDLEYSHKVVYEYPFTQIKAN